jgi:hypothetical protein
MHLSQKPAIHQRLSAIVYKLPAQEFPTFPVIEQKPLQIVDLWKTFVIKIL